MSTVDEWAKREAEERYPPEHYYGNLDECDAAQEAGSWGINRLAALLLSDEAVEAGEAEQMNHARNIVFDGGCACGEPFPLTLAGIRAHDVHVMRAALTAALTKITEDKE
jgi:hypothetical protein